MLQHEVQTIDDIDVIAATAGPGLIGGVLVGWMAATGIADATKKPLVAVNHLEGHALVPRLKATSASDSAINIDVEFPYLLMLASGGHCQILLVRGVGKYELIGQTLDDSAGEAFDKIAKMLGLGYPGGPIIDKRAQNGNGKRFHFPRPLCDKPGYDFSFSGIKTAVLNYSKKVNIKDKQIINDTCASFRQAVAETVVTKSIEAARKYGLKSISLGGGVSCNSLIRKMFPEQCKKNKCSHDSTCGISQNIK